MNKTLISQTDDHETTYLTGVRLEVDPEHVDILVKERGLDFAKGFGTPKAKESASSAGDGDQLEASEGRRAIARINFMAQDRPDLSSAT